MNRKTEWGMKNTIPRLKTHFRDKEWDDRDPEKGRNRGEERERQPQQEEESRTNSNSFNSQFSQSKRKRKEEREREERKHSNVVLPCGEERGRNVSKRMRKCHGNAGSITNFLKPIKSPPVKCMESKPIICITKKYERKIGMVNGEQCTSGLVNGKQQ